MFSGAVRPNLSDCGCRRVSGSRKPNAGSMKLAFSPAGFVPIWVVARWVSSARLVGATGRIFGVDRDPLQLAGARQYVGEQSLGNIELVEDNSYASALPGHSFDFVNARFLLAPVGHDDELLREMWRLAKPGGIIALQEPDASAWDFYPSDPDWQRLKACILAAFRN